MKTKHVNNLIFAVSLVTFLLQLVGYLAPAWFVKEVAVKHDPKGIRADGRRFHLPVLDEYVDQVQTAGHNAQESDRGCVDNVAPTEHGAPSDTLPSEGESSDDLPDFSDESEHATPLNNVPGLSSHGGSKDPRQENGFMGTSKPPPDRSEQGPPESETTDEGAPSNEGRPGQEEGNRRPGQGPPKPDGQESGGPPDRRLEEDMPQTDEREQGAPPRERQGQGSATVRPPRRGDSSNNNTGTGEHGDVNGKTHEDELSKQETTSTSNKQEGSQTGGGRGTEWMTNDRGEVSWMPGPDTVHDENTKEKKTADKTRASVRHLHLTAGFWYSRACVTTRDPDADDDTGMQWCTIYTRLDNKTLEERRNMFELRLEATLAVVLGALSLLVSSTACKSSTHQGRRAVFSLAILFISGAVMAIPVVHIIVQHVETNKQIIRPRKWANLTRGIYVAHDLFDHYSVILCGAASVISVLFAVVITLISCRSSSKSDNRYELKKSLEGEKGSKYELPINWVHSNKITVPHVAETKDETRDDCESGYSEVKVEVAVSNSDGGSVGIEDECIEFDPEEIKAFDT